MARAVTFAAVAFAWAVLLSPASASAGCGDSDDDGGGDDGSCPFPDDDGDSGPAQPACVDTTEITGLRRCTGFGHGWDVSGLPPLTFGIGVALRGLSVDGLSLGGEATHDDNRFRIRYDGADLSDNAPLTAGLTLRGTGFLTDAIYLGFEGEVTAGDATGPTVDLGGLSMTPESVGGAGGGLIGGLAVPLLPRLVLRAEVLGGARVVWLQVTTRRGDCVTTSTATGGQWLLEPRLALDWHAGPWVTLGGWVGTDLLAGGAVAGGAVAAFHFRSFDGRGGAPLAR